MKWFFSIFFCLSFVFLSVFGINCVYGYIFPVKFHDQIETACEIYDVDQAVVFSLINVESHFNKNALSSKGAVGLMQVMPSTAQGLAKEIGVEGEYDLQNPDDNIMFGTYYISKLIDKFEILETALAAYNAGPTNVTNWLNDEKYSDDGSSLKNIPFEETKNYVERFKTNYNYYSKKIK